MEVASERPAAVAARRTGFGKPAIAAIDLGTNNCRLLVARPTPESFQVVDAFSRIVRLGEGVARSGRLADTAIERAIGALRMCARIIGRYRVESARFVVTEACRRATNGHAFLERVEEETGIRLEILGREEEARLALLGCLPLIDPNAAQLLLIDIGGGSTEIMWLDRRDTRANGPLGRALSLPIGVVELAEAHGTEPDAESYVAMVEHVGTRLHQMEIEHNLGARMAGVPVQMLGTSGTVTTLAALHRGLRRYDRRRVDGTRLGFDAVERVSARLRSMTNVARAAHPCIGRGRADLVVAGCAILEAVHRLWPLGELRVADRGVREGVLNALMGRSLEAVLLSDGNGRD